MAAKKEKTKMTLFQLQIFVFIIVGFAIGVVLSFFLYKGVFETYLSQQRKYIEQDWSNVEYFTNRITDQVITLRKMLMADKARADYEKIDSIVDMRSRVLGGDSIDEKTPLIKDIVKDSQDMITYYNGRMDLRRKHFDYIKWGKDTQPLIDEFNDKVADYNAAADDFNGKIKIFPYSWIAKEKKYKRLPLVKELILTSVQTATEEYIKKVDE